jgi:hypothetical protein
VRLIEAVGTASAQRAVDARKAAAVQVAADEHVISVRGDCSERASAYGVAMLGVAGMRCLCASAVIIYVH